MTVSGRVLLVISRAVQTHASGRVHAKQASVIVRTDTRVRTVARDMFSTELAPRSRWSVPVRKSRIPLSRDRCGPATLVTRNRVRVIAVRENAELRVSVSVKPDILERIVR